MNASRDGPTTPLLLAHAGQERAGQLESTEQVDLERFAQLLIGCFFEGTHEPVAGVVHQDVDAGMCDFGGPRPGSRPVGQIQADRAEPAGCLADQSVQPCRVTGGGDDLVPPRDRSFGHCRAQTRTGTSHQPA
jgi:hypothetical protein